MTTDTTVLQDDLRELLTILGMSDHARAASPHEVFQEALGVLRKRLSGEASEGSAKRIQALGAAISRREWGEVEVAHAAIRDARS